MQTTLLCKLFILPKLRREPAKWEELKHTMEAYNSLLERTKYQQAELLIEPGPFTPDERVRKKFKPDNSFREFYGDTTVFDLSAEAKAQIGALQEELYKRSPECFSAKLAPGTMHMTLHDLSASEHLSEVAAEMFANEVGLLRIIQERPIPAQRIRMKSNFIINCVNTSLVLALLPADEGEWQKLQASYDSMEAVRGCPYPLTPHITLAYFNSQGFSAEASERLKATVYTLNQKTSTLSLDTKMLYYQKFTDMNSYYSVFPIVRQ